MINVVTFLWGSKYRAEHVNALRRQLDLYYHEAGLICVTNQPEGIDPRVKIVADTEDFADMRSPHGASFPSCYRRLRIWRSDAAQWFGERFVCIDLDVLAVGDLRPLWDRAEPIVLYRDPLYGGTGQYCGSMVLLTAGAAPEVWDDFTPTLGPMNARTAGFRGSDQAWISYRLRGATLPSWSTADGVYSYRKDIMPRGGKLPADARLTIWHGGVKPWDSKLEWARAA